jgi:hypothetical protein
MSRRTSLPGADELFRSTGEVAASASPARLTPVADAVELAPAEDRSAPGEDAAEVSSRVRSRGTSSRRRTRLPVDRRPTGRERHEEKITVYVSADELLDLEHARLTLRGDHGLAVDRGRIVREALAVVLADLDAKGETSILVRRLRGL